MKILKEYGLNENDGTMVIVLGRSLVLSSTCILIMNYNLMASGERDRRKC